jgi:hypothetical protein
MLSVFSLSFLVVGHFGFISSKTSAK